MLSKGGKMHDTSTIVCKDYSGRLHRVTKYGIKL